MARIVAVPRGCSVDGPQVTLTPGLHWAMQVLGLLTRL